MALSDADLVDQLSSTSPDELVALMLDVRRDMLAEGEPANEVACIFNRLCTVLGVDPALLRRAMN